MCLAVTHEANRSNHSQIISVFLGGDGEERCCLRFLLLSLLLFEPARTDRCKIITETREGPVVVIVSAYALLFLFVKRTKRRNCVELHGFPR